MVVGGVNAQKSLFNTEPSFSVELFISQSLARSRLQTPSLKISALITAFQLANSVPAASPLEKSTVETIRGQDTVIPRRVSTKAGHKSLMQSGHSRPQNPTIQLGVVTSFSTPTVLAGCTLLSIWIMSCRILFHFRLARLCTKLRQ